MMNLKRCFVLLLSLLVFHQMGQSQNIRQFIPYEIQKAYLNGTRSYDGQPGEQYWQNTADYKIRINVDPEKNKIEGTEEVVYYNNSPDDLKTLVVHLYHDVFKKGNARHRSIGAMDTEKDLQLKNLSINQQVYDLNDGQVVNRHGTQLVINLKEVLKAGSTLTMNVSWNLGIPESDGRTRVLNETNYMIAYFYPQIAVYDDVYGWDIQDYNLEIEFYHGLSNYDVTIQMPEEYYVHATGSLVNAKEVLPPTVAERYNLASYSEEVVAIVDTNILQQGFKTNGGLWHYKAQNVPDFAITASKNYLWDAMSVKVKEKTVLLHNLYPQEEAKYYHSIIEDLKSSIQQLSDTFPAITYPYPTMVSFKGAFWMEYPMIANNAWASDYETLHEVVHSYFPFYVRTNEKRWAWMDEGWAEYLSSYILITDFAKKGLADVFISFKGKAQMYVGSSIDVPLMTPSIGLTTETYTLLSYGIAGTALGVLHHQLGDELFLKCTKEYINRWKDKSPTPFDFFYTYENVSGQDLNWLWKSWYFEFGSPDVAIKDLKDGLLSIENKGNRPVPVFIDLLYKDGRKTLIERKADIWAKGEQEVTVAIQDADQIEKIYLNRPMIDANEEDNYYPLIKNRYQGQATSKQLLGYYTSPSEPEILQLLMDNRQLYLKVREQDRAIPLYPQENNIYASLDDFIVLKFSADQISSEVKLKISFLNDEYDYAKPD